MSGLYEVQGEVNGHKRVTDMDFTSKEKAQQYADKAKKKGAKKVRVVRSHERKVGLFKESGPGTSRSRTGKGHSKKTRPKTRKTSSKKATKASHKTRTGRQRR